MLRRKRKHATIADDVDAELMRHVDRRAVRAHRINELEVKRDATVGPAELTAIFGSWIQVLSGELEDRCCVGSLRGSGSW